MKTTGRGTVDGWLAEYLPSLLRLGTALTGDPGMATDLVGAAVSKVKGRVSRISEPDFPEAQLRAAVIQAFVSGRRRKPRARILTPEQHADSFPAELEELGNRSRACLVLRYLEQLTQAEIAAILDRPVTAVAADLRDGLAMLDVHPGASNAEQGASPRRRSEDDVRAGFAELASRAPDAQAVLGDLDDIASRSAERTRRRLVLITLASASLVLVALVPLVVLPRLPGPTRTAGEWSLIHQVAPPAGWTLLDHTVAPQFESTTLRPDNADAEQGDQCEVRAYVPGGLELATLGAQREPVRVNGHRAFFGDSGEDLDPFLAWNYARNAWATVRCPLDHQLDRVTLMRLARAVSFRRNDLALPFKLLSVPDGYRIDSATEGLAVPSAQVILAMTELRVGEANMAVAFAPLGTPQDSGSSRVMRINGRPA
ncbi:MAG: hypothetical protein H0T91_12185, partial [Propionibacteriaceae bacterium]|nr:hypothetical protein [Propionibacteriaceae bacterium]